MAIQGISKSEIERYISEFDKARTEEDGATIWLLGVLDADIRARIGDKALVMEQGADGARMFLNQGTRNLEAVRFGLKGWVNFKDDDEEVEYETIKRFVNSKPYDIVNDEGISHIPGHVLNEIGQRILVKNTMDEELRKNLNLG